MLTAFLSYLGKFIFFLVVAAAGVVAGRKFRVSKTQKNSTTEE